MSARSPHLFGSTAQLIAVCPLLAMSDTVVDAWIALVDGVRDTVYPPPTYP